MSHYIEKRRRRWYAILYIPAALQEHFGKTRFKQSLQTENQSIAQRRALVLVSQWKRKIERANGVSPLIDEAQRWRASLAAEIASDDPEDAAVVPMFIGDRAQEIEREKGTAAAELFHAVATGQAVMLEEMGDKWLAEAQYGKKADYQHRRALALLLARHKTVSEVSRRTAADFVSEALMPGRSPATVSRILSTFSQLWRWMERKGHTEANPWTNQRPTKRGTSSATRRPFTEAEAKTFLAALKGADRDVSLVMAVTGMRLEEVTALTPEDVTTKGNVTWLNVRNGKTKAATRRVPVVAGAVRKMLAGRKKDGKARLFHELEADRFGDFSSALSKRLARALRDAGMTDKALVAGHSWRHRARTLMEHADVVPWVADAVIGHARPGEGLSRYSKGPSEEQLVGAAKAIKLPTYQR